MIYSQKCKVENQKISLHQFVAEEPSAANWLRKKSKKGFQSFNDIVLSTNHIGYITNFIGNIIPDNLENVKSNLHGDMIDEVEPEQEAPAP